MTKYRVMAMSTKEPAGVGPSIIHADTADAAKELFANEEGTTLLDLQKHMVVIAEEVA